uniref:Uncharacterized protein n=1 Tax=Cacopsylla melanoneura TaxID=428564 RepID=A0A8D8Q707_9HEMI
MVAILDNQRLICSMFRALTSRRLLLILFSIASLVFIYHQMRVNLKQNFKQMHSNFKQVVGQRADMCDETDLTYFPNGTVDFRGFNNYTGYPSQCYLVPDLVHMIKFNQSEFNFIEMICIASILINHKPRELWIHTNTDFGFQGKYWEAITRLPLFDRVRVRYLEKPKTVFNFSLEHGYGPWHASDIVRLRLIQNYGGIYFDGDVFVVQSMHAYRRFEFGLEWNYDMFLGTQIEFGHKDARIIPLWLDTYKQYNASLWYYNAGELPTTSILYHKPELIHRVRDKFGTAYESMLYHLYRKSLFSLGLALFSSGNHWDWHDYSAIHLFIRHQDYDFDETSVFSYQDTPIRQMILSVMPDFLYPTITTK